MRWLLAFLGVVLALLPSACGEQPRTLPFPTPAQSDLVVLVQPGPLTHVVEDANNGPGLEHDLVEAFARELGVAVRFVETRADEIPARLARGEAHFAAGWLTVPKTGLEVSSPPLLHSRDVLVQHEASLPIDEPGDLAGRTVHAMAGSRQLTRLRELQTSIPDLRIVAYDEGHVFDLLAAVGENRVEVALVDSALLEIAQQFEPEIQATLEIGEPRPIVWLFGARPNGELLARTGAFIDRIGRDGTLERIKDRYLGHVRRLGPADITSFVERIETVLPRLRRHFLAAQSESGIDWRLIASVAYHESQWDANAVSPTGVRGIMMLTEETADHLGVGNRLDPRESIIAGANYIDQLKGQLPPTTNEPDRTWLALAAYNIGPGHFNAARALARQLKANPDSWYEMKAVLPLLAQPKYYQKLKSGRARGGEAVILTENIRSYYDILSRYEAPYRPIPAMSESMVGMAGMLPTQVGRGTIHKRRRH